MEEFAKDQEIALPSSQEHNAYTPTLNLGTEKYNNYYNYTILYIFIRLNCYI